MIRDGCDTGCDGCVIEDGGSETGCGRGRMEDGGERDGVWTGVGARRCVDGCGRG